MFRKHKVYYSIEAKSEDGFVFICSFSTYNEARSKFDDLISSNDNCSYRLLKVEKDIEEIK